MNGQLLFCSSQWENKDFVCCKCLTAAPPFPLLYLLLLAGETKTSVSSYILIDIFTNKMKLLFVSSRSPALTGCISKVHIFFVRIFTWHCKLSNLSVLSWTTWNKISGDYISKLADILFWIKLLRARLENPRCVKNIHQLREDNCTSKSFKALHCV